MSNIIIRHAGLKETDSLQMAAVHLESFNQSYITHPFNAQAMREVTDNFQNKTIAGYNEFWAAQIESARVPENNHIVLVAETYRRINGRMQNSIEAVANFIPASNEIWSRIRSSLPAELQHKQHQFHNFDLVHIRDHFRRFGIGQKLLQIGAQEALNKGYSGMLLMAFNGNGSPHWFAKNGFKHVGDIELPYGGLEPVWNVTYHDDIGMLVPVNDNYNFHEEVICQLNFADLVF